MTKKPPLSALDAMAGLRLRIVREVYDDRGPLNQADFAAKLGVTRTALANWEGGRLPDVRAMVRLFTHYGIPLEWIFLGHLRHVERALAARLEARALEVGAIVDGLPPACSPPPEVRRRRAARTSVAERHAS